MTSPAAAASRAAANRATIEGIYAAFGRGDLPAILDCIAEDVRWEAWEDASVRPSIPWLVERAGRDGVAEFFGVVGGMEMSDFAVLDVIAGERQVAVEVRIEVTLPNGGRFRDEELHLYTLDEAGKVVRMRHYVDTAKHVAAVAGADTTVS